jgi:hypothetical protein
MWEWIKILAGVWAAMAVLSLIVLMPICKLLATRRELDTVDFDDWIKRAQWAEPIGEAQCSCKEDQHE